MAKTPFKLRSGNTTPFKQMASVPVVAPPSGGMAAPPPPPSAAPPPVSPGAVPQLKKKSIAKDDPEATHPEHHETEEVDENAYEKMLLASQEAGETLTKQQEKILGKYRSRKFKEETQE